MPRSSGHAATTVSLALCLSGAALAQQTAFPQPNGYVNDFANVLDESAETYLEGFLGTLESDTTVEVAVATVPTLGGTTIEDYANRLFATWQIGQAQRDNGVLLLVAPADREVRIEVGYGLEGVLPDGLAGDIIRTEILPEFRAGNIPRGIGRGLDRIARVTRGDAASAAFVTPRAPLDDTPSPWVMVPFFGLFVMIGGFVTGVGVRTKTFALLLWGGMFAGIPLAMSVAFSPTIALSILAPLGLAICALGYVKGGANDRKNVAHMGSAGGKDTSGPDRWTMGGSSDGSSSGHSSSSSSDFGGGSSGGGGASGRW